MQRTDVALYKSYIYKFFPTLPLGRICSVTFIQRSGAHLVLKGNYTWKQLLHGREEISACLPSET